MNHFIRHDNSLYAEQVPLEKVAAQYGTPTYVYSRAAIKAAYLQFNAAFAQHEHLTCYAVKANSNIGVLNILAELGAGFDIVSGGELARVLMAGGDPSKVVFSGVGKQDWEIRDALKAGIACFNVESSSELEQLNEIGAALNVIVPISIRVNPDVDAKTHPYISTGLRENKFGVSRAVAMNMYHQAADLNQLQIKGIDCHIGSQITELEPFIEAMHRIVDMVDLLERDNISLDHIDLGGGIGVKYQNEITIDIETYAGAILQSLGHRKHKLVFEPGRFIMANAGILLTRVLNIKENEGNHFAILDAGMNDLIRPALYQSWQGVMEVETNQSNSQSQTYDLVGPICETGDFLAHKRELTLKQGSLLAIQSAGAYGFSMSSNYNSRNRAAEIMVSKQNMCCIRDRETIDDQLKLERISEFPS